MTARAAATRSTCIESNRVHFPPKLAWPRYLSWVRALFAAVAPVLCYVYRQPASALLVSLLLMMVYLVYAVFVAARGRGHGRKFGLLGLFCGNMYFLVPAS